MWAWEKDISLDIFWDKFQRKIFSSPKPYWEQRSHPESLNLCGWVSVKMECSFWSPQSLVLLGFPWKSGSFKRPRIDGLWVIWGLTANTKALHCYFQSLLSCHPHLHPEPWTMAVFIFYWCPNKWQQAARIQSTHMYYIVVPEARGIQYGLRQTSTGVLASCTPFWELKGESQSCPLRLWQS